MVSLQAAFSPEEKKPSPDLENFLSKKRKFRDGEDHCEARCFLKQHKVVEAQEIKPEDIELHLSTPLPLDWQRCLDIKSGKTHFYNTRTQKRTSEDPRLSPDSHSPSPPSLDLELNLACEPLRPRSVLVAVGEEKKLNSCSNGGGKDKDRSVVISGISGSSSPWASFDADRHEEMVATVCMHCHMLVMISKATLTCPNCKFVHPPDCNSSTAPVRRRELKLLSCRD